jgi:hypothetical protein
MQDDEKRTDHAQSDVKIKKTAKSDRVADQTGAFSQTAYKHKDHHDGAGIPEEQTPAPCGAQHDEFTI